MHTTEACGDTPRVILGSPVAGIAVDEIIDPTPVIDEIVEKYKVDQDRIYVTGLSMGGYGTWALAGFAPDRLAAIVPICGGGDPRSVRRFRRLPVWVFHGAKDSVVPLSASEEMVEALKKVNGSVKFTVYPEADHDSWTATYDDPELYKWLLEQRRSSASAERGKQ